MPLLNYDSSEAGSELKRRNSFSSNKLERASREMLDMRIAQETQQNISAVKKYQTGRAHTPVLYGHIVQLRHVGTGKWLQGDNYTADRERDCLRLTLSEGNEHCHFRLMPRFRIRREGR